MPKLLKSLFPAREDKKELRPSPHSQQVTMETNLEPPTPPSILLRTLAVNTRDVSISKLTYALPKRTGEH